jgi:hypothetical protein
MQLKTPILFLMFNRVDTTIKVFDQIRRVQPGKLFIAADGPRANVPADAINCVEVRSRILEMIDWPCQVETLFQHENLGCGRAVSVAITWFFKHVEQGIILEDDCLADTTFFFFCEELLERYQDDENIVQICGNNFQETSSLSHYSYYFSMYNHIWGWATWRRCWSKYDLSLHDYSKKTLELSFKNYGMSKDEKTYWLNFFEDIRIKPVDTWDYQWSYQVWSAGGLSILPNSNLVKNIGFGKDATHTQSEDAPIAKLKLNSLIFPLKHPKEIRIDRKADLFTFYSFYSRNENQLLSFIKRILRTLLNGRF